MKDHIQNFSLPHSTLSKRLFVVTGKGGTGKTTIALALSYALKQSGKKTLLYQSIPDQGQETATKLGISTLNLELYKSTEEYIARKLGQRTIASWILKAPFFKSLLDILPSLGDMILLGHLIDKLEEDPELTIVMDAPSTGHTLSFFESPENFKSIFKTGMLAKDIERMLSFLTGGNNLYFIIASLPSLMSIQESGELESQLNDLHYQNVNLIINNFLEGNDDLMAEKNALPDFILKKIEMEKAAIKDLDSQTTIPYFIHSTPWELVKRSSYVLQNWEAK